MSSFVNLRTNKILRRVSGKKDGEVFSFASSPIYAAAQKEGKLLELLQDVRQCDSASLISSDFSLPFSSASATESFRKRSQNGGNGKSIARTSCCARLLVQPQARVLNHTLMGERYQRRRRRQKKLYEVVKLATLAGTA